jgi:uncharacterized protein
MMHLSVLPGTYAICRLAQGAPIPEWAWRGRFFTITRTEDELSIVCEQSQVPAGIHAELEWRGIKLHGPIAFATTGVIASLTKPLAEAKISVSVIATYDTDYLFVKADSLERAIAALTGAGHMIAVNT